MAKTKSNCLSVQPDPRKVVTRILGGFWGVDLPFIAGARVGRPTAHNNMKKLMTNLESKPDRLIAVAKKKSKKESAGKKQVVNKKHPN